MHHQHHAQRDLSYPTMLILISLVQGPKHAVALCEDIQQTEAVFLEPGTLYRVLANLERRGWIEVLTNEHHLRLYSITVLGLSALERTDANRQREKLWERPHPLLFRGKEIIMRLLIWMLHLYPPTWRERYETEMVALLEQHEITLWTVLDLLIGALDARLDPHYRRSRQLLPMLRLQGSWRWFASACVACWLGFWVGDGMADLPTDPAVICSAAPRDPGCPMRVAALHVALGMHTPLPANMVVLDVGILTFFLLFPFLLILSIWIVGQAILRKRPRILLRLLPVALFSLLYVLLAQLASSPTWLYSLFLALFLASLALVSESGGAMLISARSWEKRHALPLATFVRLVALVVLSGMGMVCLLLGVWLVDLWDVLPLLNSVFPGLPVQLVLGFVIMVVALVTAVVALARSTVALRAVSAATNNMFSFPQTDRTGPTAWSKVPTVALFIFMGLITLVFAQMGLHLIPLHSIPLLTGLLISLLAGLGSMMIALAVKKDKGKVADLPKQELLR